jgi:hypothetical protein
MRKSHGALLAAALGLWAALESGLLGPVRLIEEEKKR